MNIIHKAFPNAPDRNTVRMNVVNAFSEEEPGEGTGGDASKYTYYVETMLNGEHLILTRPANLHNGFDFLISFESTIIEPTKRGILKYSPAHSHIVDDLELKKAQNSAEYVILYKYILDIYNCKEIDESWFNKIHFNVGFPCDLLLKTIKWFFIEQDIRYWNYSGRAMLFSAIPTPD